MNKWIGMGRLTGDPEVRSSADGMMIGKYTLAIDRRGKDNEADFIRVVTFGKAAEFASKYFKKGMKVLITGHIQTGSYTKEDGTKVYTTDIIAEDQEFCEKKQNTEEAAALPTDVDGFMNVPEGIMEELPFARPEVKTDADKGSKKNR